MKADLAAAFLLALVGWRLPCLAAGTRWRWSGWLLLDAAVPLATASLLLALTARPWFAGAATLMLCAIYAYADHAKRKVLAEPIVYTDVFQAFDIFRHPQLALPFPHQGRVAAVVLAVIAFFATLLHLEPEVWRWSPWPALTLLAGVLLAGKALAGPLNQAVARRLQNGPSAEPFEDSARLGPLATLLAHGLIARAQRPARQAEAAARRLELRGVASHPAPVVVVQCESFFDARRLHPTLEALPLNALDRCRSSGAQWGRLAVPCWGANTVRTEFAVLTGLSQQQLGFDRFNPYHRFAATPLASLASAMRAQGYRTLCLHPFDRRFYRRDQVMPNLGFDAFLGQEAFAGAHRINGYVSDVETARVAGEILREEGPRTFLFVITMENHGPWLAAPGPAATLPMAALGLPEAERANLARYLRGLINADQMLADLSAQLEPGAVLAFYGDHLPGFAASFAQLGLRDTRSDYVVWRAPGPHAAAPLQLDLQAHELADAVLKARNSPHGAAVAAERVVQAG